MNSHTTTFDALVSITKGAARFREILFHTLRQDPQPNSPESLDGLEVDLQHIEDAFTHLAGCAAQFANIVRGRLDQDGIDPELLAMMRAEVEGIDAALAESITEDVKENPVAFPVHDLPSGPCPN